MISFAHKNIYIHSHPIDMRKAINGLSYIVNDLSEHDPQDGSLTIFYNRSRDKVKLLYWDKNGFVMIYKRLEKGRFKIIKYDEEHQIATLDSKQLTWLLAGLDYDLMNEFKELNYSGFY